MPNDAAGIGERLGSTRRSLAYTVNVSRPYRTAVMLGVTLAIALGLPGSPLAKEYRSREVTREFQREHPCPSTGETSGGCPGYRKDHIVPLACGGPDAVSNLQWQTIAAATAKDRWELRACGR
jgi:hypothetical protein